MKQNNLKKIAKIVKKGNPSTKGAILKSSNENPKSAGRDSVKRFSVSRLVSFYGFVRRKLFTIQAAKTYNFRLTLMAALHSNAGVEYLNHSRYN